MDQDLKTRGQDWDGWSETDRGCFPLSAADAKITGRLNWVSNYPKDTGISSQVGMSCSFSHSEPLRGEVVWKRYDLYPQNHSDSACIGISLYVKAWKRNFSGWKILLWHAALRKKRLYKCQSRQTEGVRIFCTLLNSSNGLGSALLWFNETCGESHSSAWQRTSVPHCSVLVCEDSSVCFSLNDGLGTLWLDESPGAN